MERMNPPDCYLRMMVGGWERGSEREREGEKKRGKIKGGSGRGSRRSIRQKGQVRVKQRGSEE